MFRYDQSSFSEAQLNQPVPFYYPGTSGAAFRMPWNAPEWLMEINFSDNDTEGHTVTFSLPSGAITDVTDDSDAPAGPVEYYNFSGQRILNPTSGLYLRRQGSEVTKVRLP